MPSPPTNRCCCNCKGCKDKGDISRYDTLCAFVRMSSGVYYDNGVSNFSGDTLTPYHVYRLPRASVTFPWGQGGACWLYYGHPAQTFYPTTFGLPTVTIAFGCMKNFDRLRVQVFYQPIGGYQNLFPPYGTAETMTGIDSENRLTVNPYAPAGNRTSLVSCEPPHVEFFIKEYGYISDPTSPITPFRDWSIRIGPYPPDFTVTP